MTDSGEMEATIIQLGDMVCSTNLTDADAYLGSMRSS